MKCTYCKKDKKVYPVAVKSCYGDPAYSGTAEKICRDCYEGVSDTDPFFHGLKVPLFDRPVKKETTKTTN